ncbi:MAG TPA: ABC transporter ATP-binding protein [Candidatus Limnocylindrales bacterium]|nr:ABC transporter ATP-binding protein [Candidatus Limnocylindrales bacterium]
MHLLIVFARRYPSRTIIMLVCLTLAAMAEGVGLSTMMPLLSMVTGSKGEESALEHGIRTALAAVGVTPTLGVLLVLIVAGSVVKASLMLLAQRQVGYTVAHVATDLRLALLRALLQARWLYYIRQPVGLLANAFATEALRASEAYLYGTTLMAQLIQTILYVAIAAFVSWQTTLAASFVGLFSIGMLSGLVRKTKRAGVQQTDLMRALLARMTDVLYSVKPLKAMGREPLVAPLLEHETQSLNRSLQKQVLSKEAVRALQEPLLIGTIAAGLYIATSYWDIAVNGVIMLSLIFARALFSLQKAQKQYQAMAACESAFWSLQKTIDESARESEVTTGTREPIFEHSLSVVAVDFAYEERPILAGATLEIVAGEVTAIVGPSGAGKTTIADLALGLVKPQGGEVLLDGVPLSEIDVAKWRHCVGYVPQEMLLLHEDVMLNVTLGDPALTRADVEEALQAAGATEFVRELPQGLETPLGERGARLSGGQRQRIAIARALVHRPSLLILDEATASLDPASEAGIYETVRALRGRTTILAISHQPGLLKVADRVYRLSAGRIALLEGDARYGDHDAAAFAVREQAVGAAR